MRQIRVPHTLVLLFGMMVLAWAATWLLPSGAFDTHVNEAGREQVVPGTFSYGDDSVGLSPGAIFTAVPRAFADAQGIIFFLFIIGGALAVVRETGAIDALLGRLLSAFGHRLPLMLGGGVLLFATGSSALGMSAEYVPFIGILVSLCLAMRLDALTAVAIVLVGYGIGYGVALFNPYTLLVAQQVAGLDPMSGNSYRAALLVPFCAIGIHHIWSYARRVQKDPSASLLAGQPSLAVAPSDYPSLESRHGVVLVLLLAAMGLVVHGVGSWSGWGWYLTEMGAVFIGLSFVVAIAGRLSPDRAAGAFVEGATAITSTALLVGIARAIALIMEDGEILHVIVHAVATPLEHLGAEAGAVGMLAVQSLLNVIVPSGSGQAYVSMPLMAPIGDLVGVPRQAAVLAYQFGDGFTNIVTPTNAILMGILGVAGVPYDRWLRFVAPLMVKLGLAASVALVAAVIFDYA